MTRFFCALLLLAVMTLMACETLLETLDDGLYNASCRYEKYMSLQPVGYYTAQGAACYGDYLVQGYNNNAYITIYDLKKKECIGTIDIPDPSPSSRTHSNTLNFGCQRINDEDYFPLLYVSSGYTIGDVSYIYVYRLLKDRQDNNDRYIITLVQTIALIGFGSWTEGIVDGENNKLWVKYEKGGPYGYALYELPDAQAGDVSLSFQSYIRTFSLDQTPLGSRNQGHLYFDNHILLVSGVPSSGEAIAFVSINTITEKRDLIVDLAKIGLVNPDNVSDNTYEPESVFYYDDQLMIGYRTAVYSFDIDYDIAAKNGW